MDGGVRVITAAQLVGAWRLVSARVSFSDGRPAVQPYGPDGSGSIVYSAEGWMSAVLTEGSRAPLGSTSLETSNRASDADKLAAFESYLSYAGRWRLDGDEVVHSVEMALNPNAVGQEQRRRVRWEGGDLVLSYQRTPPSGTVRTFELTWRRVTEEKAS